MLRAPRVDRRRFSLFLAGALCGSSSLARVLLAQEVSATPDVASPTISNEKVSLLAATEPVEMQVHAVLEGTGELVSRPIPGAKTKPTTFTLKVLGDLVYAEKSLLVPGENSPTGALRWYQQASADTDIAGKPRKVTLRDERRHFLIRHESDRATYRCLEGPLTRDERDLLELPAASHCLNSLLPSTPVATGETWTLDDVRVAQLLNLDAITVQDVVCQMDSLDDQAAQLSLKGTVHGSVRGVTTEIGLKGKYQFDRIQQQVAWLALGIKENREPGLAEPGYQVIARLRIGRTPSESPSLSTQMATDLEQSEAQPSLLEYRPKSGRFSLVHGPQWYLFEERSDLTVLRYIDGDRLIAQCNLRPMEAIPLGSGLTLNQFRDEIRSALGRNAQQIIDSRESTMPDQTRQLRVSVGGQIADASIHWIYFQLTDVEGRRMTCVFTLSSEHLERFGAEDYNLVGGLNLAPLNPPAESPVMPESEPVAQVPTETATR